MDELLFGNNSESSPVYNFDSNSVLTFIDPIDIPTFGGGGFDPGIDFDNSTFGTYDLVTFDSSPTLPTSSLFDISNFDDIDFINNKPSLDSNPVFQPELAPNLPTNEWMEISVETTITLTPPGDITEYNLNQPPVVETELFNNEPFDDLINPSPTNTPFPNPIPAPFSIVDNSEADNPLSEKERGGNSFYC